MHDMMFGHITQLAGSGSGLIQHRLIARIIYLMEQPGGFDALHFVSVRSESEQFCRALTGIMAAER